jgi:predicted RNA-binding protein Jag
MKSIIEQASSIMKAIEKAWNQAEQPKEFSIKIFEKEERNFFGMTTKPAKVGIFFGDKPIIHEKQTQRARPEIKECRSTFPKAPAEKPVEKSENKAIDRDDRKNISSDKQAQKPAKQQPRPAGEAKPMQQRPQHNAAEKKQATTQQQQQLHENAKPRRTPATWNETMASSAHNWLKKTLDLMNMQAIEFSSEIAGKNMKLTFNKPLIADITHEKQLFRSFAHLIMSSLRNQYKQEIKDLKVILIRPE